MSENIYLAKIHIPIIQRENGTLDSLTDHIHIYYEQTNVIPPKSNSAFTYNAIKEQLTTFLEKEKIRNVTIKETIFLEKDIKNIMCKGISNIYQRFGTQIIIGSNLLVRIREFLRDYAECHSRGKWY